MRKARMTKEEYEKAKEELKTIDKEIKKLKEIRNPILNRIRWYEYTEGKASTKHQTGYAYQRFGKRAKDLNEEERKIYNREMAAISRKRYKK